MKMGGDSWPVLYAALYFLFLCPLPDLSLCLLVDVTDEYLDAYHSIDSSVEILMRSLRDNPPRATDDDDDDDYEDDDYYDDDDEDTDDNDDDDDDFDDDDDSYIYDDHDGEDDASEEDEDESVLDADVDRNVESKSVNQESYNEDEGACDVYTDCEISILAYMYAMLHKMWQFISDFNFVMS